MTTETSHASPSEREDERWKITAQHRLEEAEQATPDERLSSLSRLGFHLIQLAKYEDRFGSVGISREVSNRIRNMRVRCQADDEAIGALTVLAMQADTHSKTALPVVSEGTHKKLALVYAYAYPDSLSDDYVLPYNTNDEIGLGALVNELEDNHLLRTRSSKGEVREVCIGDRNLQVLEAHMRRHKLDTEFMLA